MKNKLVILLMLFITSCTASSTSGEAISSSTYNSVNSSEMEKEIAQPEEDKSIIDSKIVVVTKLNDLKPSLNNLFGENYSLVTKYQPERFQNVEEVVFIYDSQLLKETPPGTFGVFRFEALDFIVKTFNNRKISLIHPSNQKHAVDVINSLKIEDFETPTDQRLLLSAALDELYPGMSKHGKIGVLTKTVAAGGSIGFLPRGTHTIVNDPNNFFSMQFDTRIIMYETQDDLNYPPSRFNKTLERGEIDSFKHTDGSRIIMIRYSNVQRFESYFLDERVLNFEGKYTSDQVFSFFNNRKNLQERPVPFVSPNVPYKGEFSSLENRLSPINACKLEQKNKRVGEYSNQKGFPFYTRIPVTGEVNIAILAVDFPDVPGEADFLPIYQSQISTLESWSEFVSDGKMNYKVHFPNQWIRAPKEARFYTTLQSRLSNQQYWGAAISEDLQPTSESIQQILVAADEYVDWSVVDFLQILFPLDSHKYGVFLYSHGMDLFTPNAGRVNIPVFGDVVAHFTPLSPDPLARTMWDWVAHEILHFQGIIGHGPMNGGHFGVMMNQHGLSKALISWESFIMGHFDEEQIACIEPDNLSEELIIKLNSLDAEGGKPGIKSLMIPLNDKEMIVVEKRSDGPFSKLTPEYRGFTAYYMDISRQAEGVRCDVCDPIKMELTNFWRYIRNDNETLYCDTGFLGHSGLCGYPSVVQHPGYYLDFNGFRFEFFNDGVLSVKRLFN